MTWSYSLSRRAERDLENVGAADQRRILEALDRIAADPIASGVDVVRISGSQGDLRPRVGRWRVIFYYDHPERMTVVTRVLLPARDRRAIHDRIGRLAADPGSADLTTLAGRRNRWRLRAGQWRAILELNTGA